MDSSTQTGADRDNEAFISEAITLSLPSSDWVF